MRFKLNWRFLLKLSAVVLVAGIAIHFTHRWQARRQVGAFLRQADNARDAKDTAREIAYLQRYLMARSSDVDARERLARLLCAAAKTRRDRLEAYLILEEVLRRDPGRDELRRYAIDFAMDPRSGMYPEAQGHIDTLLQKRPADGELEGLMARCLEHSRKYGEAATWYERSYTHRPDLVRSYAARAALLRLYLNRNDEADADMARMLKANNDSYQAHLFVAEYWRAFGQSGQQAVAVAKPVADSQGLAADTKVAHAREKAVREAQRCAPDEIEVILAVSNLARSQGHEFARAGDKDKAASATAEAHRTLKVGLAKHSKAPAIYLAMAALEAESRHEKEPLAVIRDGLAAIPEFVPLLIALADYQIRAGDVPGATETLDTLKRQGLPPNQAELQQARILMVKGDWLEASLILEKVRQDTPDDPNLGRQASLYLGRCYTELGMLDRQLDAFRRAIPIETTDPLWVPAMLGVAEAEAALGKSDAALQAYITLKDRTGGAWVPIARLHMIKALQTPTGKEPDWAPTEEALAAAEQVLPKDTEVQILRATYLHFRGNQIEARKRLTALTTEKPKETAVWIALASQDQREGNLRTALDTLAVGEKEAGDSPELRLARAQLWVEIKEPELERKLDSLTVGIERWSLTQQRALVRGLARLAPAPLARRLWDRVAGLQEFDLGVHLIRFDLTLRDGDEPAMGRVLADIRKVDGEAGSSSRLARAVLLIWRAQHKKEVPGLDEAMTLLRGLDRERGGWARVAYAQALIYDMRGDVESAFKSYQKAIDSGESNPDALRRLMELLAAAGKDDEAWAILQRLPKPGASDHEAQKLAAEVSLRINPAQAVNHANNAVPANSTNPADYIWQGQLYFSAGETKKAEASFRRATALRPDAIEGWLTLLRYLTLSNRRADAEKLLEEAKDKVNKTERILFLAMGYALVGRIVDAGKAFEQARTERPTDLRTVRAEAEFLFQTGQANKEQSKDAAIQAFERVLALQTATPADKDFARMMIGICLVTGRDSRRALEQLGLVEGDRLRPPSGNETPAERRLRIIALALQRDRVYRLEAIRLLEVERDQLSGSDQFLLAQLYLSVGNRGQVRVVMVDLLRKSGRVARYVQFYAVWLIRTGEHQEAEPWVKRLTELQPDALETAELRARLAAAKGNLAAARDIIVPRAKAPDAPVLAISQLCEELKLYDDAERLLKDHVEKLKPTQPQAPLLLAAHYGRRGRMDQALLICDEARKTLPMPQVGMIAIDVLYAGSPKASEMALVAGWLDDAAKKPGADKAALLQQLASVRNLQGEYDAAMALYRDALRVNASDVLAMNNLAFLLSAVDQKHDEALRLIEGAKKLAGPLPDLLDTEALIRLNNKDYEGARRLLELVVIEAPSGSAYFHLARTELAANRRVEAALAWRQAGEYGLKAADLHPLERDELKRIADLMK